MKQKQELRMSTDYLVLPDDLVVATILWRLPIKSILQCRCVCKSWNSLITSSNFVSTHFLRKTLTLNPQILLNQRCISRYCLVFDYEDYLRSMLFCIPHLPSNPDIQIVGSVNGLICFSIGEDSVEIIHHFIICNPSIGKFQSIALPNSSSPVRNLPVKGFGFDERSQDYKIVLIISDKDGFIFSLNLNRWRRITCAVPKNWFMKRNSVVFVNGSFHWVSRDGFIMIFDVKNEAFGHISLPKCLVNSRHNLSELMEFGESSLSISIFQYYGSCTDIWIMKEYGSVESWTKLVTLAPEKMFLGFENKYQALIYGFDKHIISQKINNGKLELEVKKISFEEVGKMVDVDNGQLVFTAHKYVPSLVLLDKENNIDIAAPTHTKRIKSV